MDLDLQTGLLIVIVLLLVWHLFLRKERAANVNAGKQQSLMDWIVGAATSGSSQRSDQVFSSTNQ